VYLDEWVPQPAAPPESATDLPTNRQETRP